MNVKEYWGGSIKIERSKPPVIRAMTITDENHTLLPDIVYVRARTLVRWAWDVSERGPSLGVCPDPVFAGIIKASITSTKSYNGLRFHTLRTPMLSLCKCGSFSKVYGTGMSGTELEAFLIGMAKWAADCHKWDNAPPRPRVCSCESRNAKLRDQDWPAEIEADSGWMSRKAGRCITDYNRTLRFSRSLDATEISLVLAKVRALPNPGNNHPNMFVDDDMRHLHFRATHDSSD